VSALAIVYRNAAPVTVGVSAGNIAVSYTTGRVTFVPDVTRTISAITKASPGKITTSANHGFSTGDKIYLDSIGGMTELNDTVVTITVVDADEFTIGVNTSSYTTFTTGGNAKKGPQPADALTWAGPFDVPVRFVSDWFRAVAETARHAEWPDIELLEILTGDE
jgi:hypothetical protein